MISVKAPTFARYERVENILEADRAIKAQLGPKTEIVCKPPPSCEKVKFSVPVVRITESFHAKGMDAHTVSKNDILDTAIRCLRAGGGVFKFDGDLVPVKPAPVAEPAVKSESVKPKFKPEPEPVKAPEPEPEPEPEPVPVPKPASVKPKFKPEPEPVKAPEPEPVPVPKPASVKPKFKPEPEPEPTPVKSKLVPVSEPDPKSVIKASVARKRSAQPEPVANKVQLEVTANPDEEEDNDAVVLSTPGQRALQPGFPLAMGCSIVTLFMAADSLISCEDTFPGKQARQQKLADLIKEYQALTVLDIPKNSKSAR